MAGSVTGKSAARAMLAEGELWRDHIARLAFPVVLWCAKYGHTITYGQLAKELERRHGEKEKFRKTLYGMPAGKIGNVLEELSEEWGESIPPVNAVIVNGDTGLPGSGVDSYLQHFLSAVARRKRMDQRNRDALAREVIETVFDYPRWDAVAAALGYERLPAVSVVLERSARPIELPDPVPVRGGGGESDLHRQLKEWVAAHPERFAEFGAFKKGKMEALLQSGDEIDVLFEGKDAVLAAEVKAANAPESEFRRGLFQCVKYRAVLRATQLVAGNHPNAQAVLVVEHRLSDDLADLAKRLRVVWISVNPK